MLSFSSFFAVLLFLKWFIQSSEINFIVLGTQWKKILLNQPKIILFYVARPFTDFEMFAILFPEVRWKNAIEDVLPEEEEKEDHFFHFRLYTVHSHTGAFGCSRPSLMLFLFGPARYQPPPSSSSYVLPKASVERAALACCMYAMRGNTWNFCSVFFVYSFFLNLMY